MILSASTMIDDFNSSILKCLEKYAVQNNQCEVSQKLDNYKNLFHHGQRSRHINQYKNTIIKSNLSQNHQQIGISSKMIETIFSNVYDTNPIKRIYAFKSIRLYVKENKNERDNLAKLGILGIIKHGLMTNTKIIIFEVLLILNLMINYIVKNPEEIILSQVMKLVKPYCKSQYKSCKQYANYIVEIVNKSKKKIN